MTNPVKLRMARRLREMYDRYENCPDIDGLLQDQDDIDSRREQRSEVFFARVDEQIIIDQIPSDDLDGGRMSCQHCGLSSDHESMLAARDMGVVHAQECGGQS